MNGPPSDSVPSDTTPFVEGPCATCMGTGWVPWGCGKPGCIVLHWRQCPACLGTGVFR